MMSVSTYNAEILIYTGRLAECAKSAHSPASQKGHRSAYSVLCDAWKCEPIYGINNLISIYRLFYFDDEVLHNVNEYIL